MDGWALVHGKIRAGPQRNLIPTPHPSRASLVPQLVKNLPAMQEIRVRSLAQEDPLEKGSATHSSILAWRIPWTEEPSRLQSMASQSQRRQSDFHFDSSWTSSFPLYTAEGWDSRGGQRRKRSSSRCRGSPEAARRAAHTARRRQLWWQPCPASICLFWDTCRNAQGPLVALEVPLLGFHSAQLEVEKNRARTKRVEVAVASPPLPNHSLLE